jgi:hypothetical protein
MFPLADAKKSINKKLLVYFFDARANCDHVTYTLYNNQWPN